MKGKALVLQEAPPFEGLPKSIVKLHDRPVVQVIIVVVGDDNKVDVRQIWISQLKGRLDKAPEDRLTVNALSDIRMPTLFFVLHQLCGGTAQA